MLQLPSYNKGLVKSLNYWPAKPAKASFEGYKIKQGTNTRGELKEGCKNFKYINTYNLILDSEFQCKGIDYVKIFKNPSC